MRNKIYNDKHISAVTFKTALLFHKLDTSGNKETNSKIFTFLSNNT